MYIYYTVPQSLSFFKLTVYDLLIYYDFPIYLRNNYEHPVYDQFMVFVMNLPATENQNTCIDQVNYVYFKIVDQNPHIC
jgi:hypothetical protein